jgi:two-component system, cell cycle response regulator DivK
MSTGGGRSNRSNRPPRRRNTATRRRRLTVLIVDDTPDVRDLYAQYLSALGCHVVTAADGEAGIATAKQCRPDVIVMDLSMPKLDGIGAMKQLKADPRTRRVPVILLTGYPYAAIEQGAIEAGADVFLTKPCLPEDLHARITSAYGQRSRRAA